MVLPALLLACTAPTSAPADSRARPDAWVWEDSGVNRPALDPVVFAADVEAHLLAMRSITAVAPLASFAAAYDFGTPPVCPRDPTITASPEYGTTLYFDGLCTMEPMTFKGPALYYSWENQAIQAVGPLSSAASLPSDIRWTGHGFNGQTDIYNTDGSLDFNCSCTMVSAIGEDSEGVLWFLGNTEGTAHWTGPEGTDTWMEDPAVNPAIRLTTQIDGESMELTTDGTLSGVGERYRTMGWLLQLGKNSSGCSGELDLQFRDDADARWSELSFSVDSSCTACVSIEEGTACVDLAPLLDFERSPWE